MIQLRRALLLLQYLWQTPLTLLGLVVALLYLPYGVRWHDGALDVRCLYLFPWWGSVAPSGQCLGGLVICYRRSAWDRRELQVHERVHVEQGRRWYGGLLFPISYFGGYVVAAIRGGHWYRDSWAEREAYGVQEDWEDSELLAEAIADDDTPITIEQMRRRLDPEDEQ